MSSKSATTDPRAFSLSFALAACSRSFFCNFASYVSGASPVGSGLGARVKVTSTCIVKRAESAAWRRADSAQCPGLSGADSAQCPTGWVPSGLASPLGASGRPPEPLSAHRGGAAAELGALYKAALWPRAMAPRRLRSHGPKDTQAVLHPPLSSPGSRAGSSAAWRLQACNSSAGPRLVGMRAGVGVGVGVGVRAGVGLGVGLMIRVGVGVRVRVRV